MSAIARPGATVALALAAAAMATGMTVSACTPTGRPAAEGGTSGTLGSLPLNTVPLSCPAAGARRDCTSPGTVRWSVPAPGRYDVGFPGQLMEPTDVQSTAAYGRDAEVTFDGPTTIYQNGGTVQAIDTATGSVLWRTSLPAPGGGEPASMSGIPPVVSGSTVAVEACLANKTRAWLLDAATGAPSPSVVIRNDCQEGFAAMHNVIALADGLVVVCDDIPGDPPYGLRGIDPATGAVVWHWLAPPSIPLSPSVSLTPPFDSVVIDGVYYIATSGGQILRVDLSDGQELPPLPVGRPSGGTVAGVAPGALLYTGNGTISRLDPSTGRTLWTEPRSNSTPDDDDLTVGYDTAADAVVYDTLVDGSYQRQYADLATGSVVMSAPAGAMIRYEQKTRDEVENGPGNGPLMYADAYVTTSAATGMPTGSPSGDVRVEGINPRSGRLSWVGPLSENDAQLTGGPPTGPPVVLVQACAPDGVSKTFACTKPVLYAINA